MLPAICSTHQGYLLRFKVLIVKISMKRSTILFIFIATFLLDSCEPAATFDQPQPDGEKPLTFFPEYLRGVYLASNNASTVTITDKLITRHYDFDYKEHKDSLGSSYQIMGDKLINLKDSSKENVVVKGDTILRHYEDTDTLFNISTDNVLKKFKGYFFLNSRYGVNAWEVKKIALQKGELKIGNISNEGDILKLREITKTTTDTASTQFSLTRRQFKKFVRQEGFSEQETFIRVRENGR